MGTWISHLRIAEGLLGLLPGVDEVAFTFGNLAPDSGIPNADWTVFDPPKEVTHFLRPGEDEGRIKDMEFYRLYLAPLVPEDDAACYGFALGYFCHLLCDNLWSKRIGGPSKQAYTAIFGENRSAMWEAIKEDWYGLDQCYVRDHSDSIFWRVLMRAPNPPAYLPLVPLAGLHQQLDYIRVFYSQPEASWVLDRPYPYLSAATMTQFVNDSVTTIGKICRNLQAFTLSRADTALSMLDDDEISPYPLPLGDPG